MILKASNFVNLLREQFKSFFEDIDRERRHKRGYGLEDEGKGVSYGDLPENIENEDADRLRRAADGYGETEFEEDVAIMSSDEEIADVLGLGQEDLEMEKQGQEGRLSANAEKLAKALKGKPGIDNPYALAQWMNQQGLKKKKEESIPSLASVVEKKKRKKAMSHAAPSEIDVGSTGRFPGPPAGPAVGESFFVSKKKRGK